MRKTVRKLIIIGRFIKIFKESNYYAINCIIFFNENHDCCLDEDFCSHIIPLPI